MLFTKETLVTSNRELIEHFEKKIQASIAPVWGKDSCRPVI